MNKENISVLFALSDKMLLNQIKSWLDFERRRKDELKRDLKMLD